jgi:hypothetical protein
MSTKTTYTTDGSIATLISTGLNSLANNSLVAGSAYSGSGNYLMAEIELVVTFGTSPTANTGASIWFLRSIDGTNTEDGSSSVTPSRAPDLVIPFEVTTSAQRIIRRCIIPPGTFTPLLKNDGSGQAFAASGNTLKILPVSYVNG